MKKNDVVNKWLDDYHHYIQSSSTRAEDKDTIPVVVVLEDSDAENEDHDECAAGTINPDDMQAKNDIPTTKVAVFESGTSKSEEKMKKNFVRPVRWLFPGILAMLLYGPFKQNENARRTLNFMKFYDDLDSDKKKKGRGHDTLLRNNTKTQEEARF
jgi:hypothetical protein